MSQEFRTAQDNESLSKEVTSLKIMMAFLLKSMNQVDAGKVMLNMERYLNSLEEGTDKELFRLTLQQVKEVYLS